LSSGLFRQKKEVKKFPLWYNSLMKKAFFFITLLLGVIFVWTISVDGYKGISQEKFTDYLASIFFIDSATEASLRQTFHEAKEKNDKVKVLIVPGHDDISWGTDFRGVKEADLTVALGEELHGLFKENSLFEVKISRTSAGHDKELDLYIEGNKQGILDFMKVQKSKMGELIDSGKIVFKIVVEHATSTSRTIQRLYGINKWANENGYDLVIHIHFNDYAGRKKSATGKYSGFSVYVPEGNFSNAKGSRAVGESIFKRLRGLYPVSNFPNEGAGIIEDQELIGVGAYNTLDGAGILIEYDYIYEPILVDRKIRNEAISDYALQTYLGVMDFFEPSRINSDMATAYLPYEWNRNLFEGTRDPDVLSLQAALMREGVYPPAGFSRNDCPLTGAFGPCTERAVKAFQKKYNLEPVGQVGPKTRAKLNKIYGI